MGGKERADKILVERELAGSRQKAQALIMAGLVYSEGIRIEKPGQMLKKDQKLHVDDGMLYVGRGGLKLQEALETFHISANDAVAVDLGASTGGFTDCLLQRGAKKVYAVDVDTRQIDWQLRKDPRVVLIEKNARYLKEDDFDEAIDIVTTDLSFISVLKVLPAVQGWIGYGLLLSLIKPQFEVGRDQVGKKGIVRDPSLHEEVLRRMVSEAREMGWNTRGVMRVSLKGQKGNREFFILWSASKPPLSHEEEERSIKEAVWNEEN